RPGQSPCANGRNRWRRRNRGLRGRVELTLVHGSLRLRAEERPPVTLRAATRSARLLPCLTMGSKIIIRPKNRRDAARHGPTNPLAYSIPFEVRCRCRSCDRVGSLLLPATTRREVQEILSRSARVDALCPE